LKSSRLKKEGRNHLLEKKNERKGGRKQEKENISSLENIRMNFIKTGMKRSPLLSSGRTTEKEASSGIGKGDDLNGAPSE